MNDGPCSISSEVLGQCQCWGPLANQCFVGFFWEGGLTMEKCGFLFFYHKAKISDLLCLQFKLKANMILPVLLSE